MKQAPRQFNTQLAVIGSGMAGFAASIFALNRHIQTTQLGNTGALAYTTGYLDLLGMEGAARVVDSPWQALHRLADTEPRHPLCQLAPSDIRQAFVEFTAFLGEFGVSYTAPGDNNLSALSPIGTVKPTLCLPQTMAAGPTALTTGADCVIVDIHGLKGFSGPELVANLRDRWPALRTQRIRFPDMATGEVYPEVMARALEVSATRARLAELLKGAAGDATVIGLPAILGMHQPDQVHAELQRLTGLQMFEIPTMPPSVAGLRLRELFEQALPRKGATLIPQQKVRSLQLSDGGATLALKDSYGEIEVQAQAVILASGRLLSGGLEAHTDGIREHLLNLPVVQPANRSGWYQDSYTDPRGHPINRAGIEVDALGRPLGTDGACYHPRLFAAGAVLAHHDWIRSRSGAGVALASAWRAVAGVMQLLGQRTAEFSSG
jgi:glycerol-3-phosphate dehydrogenase subunit B